MDVLGPRESAVGPVAKRVGGECALEIEIPQTASIPQTAKIINFFFISNIIHLNIKRI